MTLCEYAMLSKNTRGRAKPIEESPLRTPFMRDRDRIVHCKSFRRLKDKTQVFLYPEGSHYRTRLTHTMEVSQIARTIARALRLNEDLTEAIALGHDLGHTPFGHAGERVLNDICGFEHNVQSLRVVDKLENGTGLNLTWEVRDGIINHKKRSHPALEGMAVNYADRIAYLNHDIDDTIRAGLFSIDDLPADCIHELGRTHSGRINTMITDIVNTSMDRPYVRMSEGIEKVTEELRNYMFENVYEDSPAKREEKKVHHIITLIYEHYMEHEDELPEHYLVNIEEDGASQCVIDYIAGMTDKYIVNLFSDLYVPRNWTIY